MPTLLSYLSEKYRLRTTRPVIVVNKAGSSGSILYNNKDILGQFRFLGNYPPTPPLS